MPNVYMVSPVVAQRHALALQQGMQNVQMIELHFANIAT